MLVQLETGGAFSSAFPFVLISTGLDLFGYSRTTLREIKTQEMEKCLQYTQNVRTLFMYLQIYKTSMEFNVRVINHY